MSKQRHIYHLVFTTKRHKMTIPMDGKEILLDRIIQIFSGKGCHVYAANAFLNHVHILVEIPQPDNFNKIVNKVKGSTGVLHLRYPEYAEFSDWAPGFDSFSVSFGDLERVRRFIREQSKIHLNLSFEEEYRQLLEEHGFDTRQMPAPAPPATILSENNNP